MNAISHMPIRLSSLLVGFLLSGSVAFAGAGEIGPKNRPLNVPGREIDQYVYTANAMQRTNRSGRYEDVIIAAQVIKQYRDNPNADPEVVAKELNAFRSEYEKKKAIAANPKEFHVPQTPIEIMNDFNDSFGPAGRLGKLALKYGVKGIEAIAGPELQGKFQNELMDDFAASQTFQQVVWEELHKCAETNPKCRAAADQLLAIPLNAKTKSTAAQIVDANDDLKRDQEITWIMRMVGPNGPLSTSVDKLRTQVEQQQTRLNTELKESRKRLDQLSKIVKDDIASRERAELAAREAALRTEAERSSVYLMSRLLGIADPKLGEALSASGNAVLTIKGAVENYASNSAMVGAGMAGAILTGNIASALLSVVSSCSAAGPDSTQLILAQLQQLSEQVEELRTEMHAEFGLVNLKLDAIYAEIVASFSELREQLSSTNANVIRNGMTLVELREQLAKSQVTLVKYFQIAANRDLKLIKTKCHQFQNPGKAEFRDCLAGFLSESIDWSTDNLSLGSPNRGVEPRTVSQEMMYDPEFNIAYVLSAAERLSLLKVADSSETPNQPAPVKHAPVIRNPIVWSDGAMEYLDVVERISKQYRSDRTFTLDKTVTDKDLHDHIRQMIAAGDDLVVNIQRLDNPAGGGHIAFCRNLSVLYAKQSKLVAEQIVACEKGYKDIKNFGFDLWSSADQDYVPKAILRSPKAFINFTAEKIVGADVTYKKEDSVELEVPTDLRPYLKPFTVTEELAGRTLELSHRIRWIPRTDRDKMRFYGRLSVAIYATAEDKYLFWKEYTQKDEVDLGEVRWRAAGQNNPIGVTTPFNTLLPQPYALENWAGKLNLRDQFVREAKDNKAAPEFAVRWGEEWSPKELEELTKQLAALPKSADERRKELIKWGNAQLDVHRRTVNTLISSGLVSKAPDPSLHLDGIWGDPKMSIQTLSDRSAELEGVERLIDAYLEIAQSPGLWEVKKFAVEMHKAQAEAVGTSSSIRNAYDAAVVTALVKLNKTLDALAADDISDVVSPSDLISTTLFRLKMADVGINLLPITRDVGDARAKASHH